MKKRHFITHANKVMRKLFDFSSNVVQMSMPKPFRILICSIYDNSLFSSNLTQFQHHHLHESFINTESHRFLTHDLMEFQLRIQIQDISNNFQIISFCLMPKRHFITHANKVMRLLFDFSSNVVQMSTPKQFRILMQSIDDKSRLKQFSQHSNDIISRIIHES